MMKIKVKMFIISKIAEELRAGGQGHAGHGRASLERPGRLQPRNAQRMYAKMQAKLQIRRDEKALADEASQSNNIGYRNEGLYRK